MTTRPLPDVGVSAELQSVRAGAEHPSPEQIAASIRDGQWPTDAEFDRCMRYDMRRVSSSYWSQLAVSRLAARWFARFGIETVVDIGSGAGKFCVAAALGSQCRFIGLEHRPHLVSASRLLATSFGVEHRVHFLHATFGECLAPVGDAYYFYNPFGENLFPHDEHFDSEVELSSERYIAHVAAAEALLRHAPIGTCLLVYNGFGGRVPSSYSPIMRARRLPSVLRMWRKMTDTESGEGELACAEHDDESV